VTHQALQRVAQECKCRIFRGVVCLALGIVNAYLIGEAGGPWVLVDAGTPGNAEKIRAAAQERFGQGARPEAIVLTHGHADHSGCARELSDSWDVPIYATTLNFPSLPASLPTRRLTQQSAAPPPS
jgi:glyoxylase-like metal-dependent hydrolase (beta-lactamase superfamily II)